MRKGIMSSKRAKRLVKMRDYINNSDMTLDYKDLSDVFGVSPAQASLDIKLLLGKGKVRKDKVFYGKTIDDIFSDENPLGKMR